MSTNWQTLGDEADAKAKQAGQLTALLFDIKHAAALAWMDDKDAVTRLANHIAALGDTPLARMPSSEVARGAVRVLSMHESGALAGLAHEADRLARECGQLRVDYGARANECWRRAQELRG